MVVVVVDVGFHFPHFCYVKYIGSLRETNTSFDYQNR